MQQLSEEIHSCFTGDNDITIQSAAKLPYLSAVIEESLRLYPPVAAGLRRVVPEGGAVIDGHFVPENVSCRLLKSVVLLDTNEKLTRKKTLVACHHYASFHSSSNFAYPNDFIPERWLGTDPRFDDDKRNVLQPFSLGPRNCPGKG